MPLNSQANRRVIVLLALVSGLCLLCIGVFTSLNVYAQSPQFGNVAAEFCVGYMQIPDFKIGFYWSLPIFSYLPYLATAPTHICLYIPYDLVKPVLNWLPREIVIPP